MTKKETFTGNLEELDAWIENLNDEELNGVLYYLTIKEMQEMKKKMSENEGKVLTPEEFKENAIIPKLKEE